MGWLPQLDSRTLDIIFVRMIDNSNKYLLNQIMRASTFKNNEVSYLWLDRIHAPRFITFTDSVNQ